MGGSVLVRSNNSFTEAFYKHTTNTSKLYKYTHALLRECFHGLSLDTLYLCIFLSGARALSLSLYSSLPVSLPHLYTVHGERCHGPQTKHPDSIAVSNDVKVPLSALFQKCMRTGLVTSRTRRRQQGHTASR